MHSSSASAICRLEWRPSRLLGGALVLIGVLAAVATVASGMPASVAWPIASAACCRGILMARRERQRGPRELVITATEGASRIDGEPMASLRVSWRGPLAFLAWRDEAGRRRRLSFWPDTLPAARRRELRLAAPAPDSASRAASVAP